MHNELDIRTNEQYDIHRSWSNSRILRRATRRHDRKRESIGFIGKHSAASFGRQDVEQCNLRAARLMTGGLSFFISDWPPETYKGRNATSPTPHSETLNIF